MCNCVCEMGDRNDPDTIWRLYVPRQGGGLVRLDSLVQLVPAQSPSRIDRDGQAAHGEPARCGRPRLCPGRSS